MEGAIGYHCGDEGGMPPREDRSVVRLKQQDFERAFRKSGPTLHYLYPLDEGAQAQAQQGEDASFDEGVWMIVVSAQPYAVGLRRDGEDMIVSHCRTWFMVETMIAQVARTNDYPNPAKSDGWLQRTLAKEAAQAPA
jgi:hypothetical protein